MSVVVEATTTRCGGGGCGMVAMEVVAARERLRMGFWERVFRGIRMSD